MKLCWQIELVQCELIQEWGIRKWVHFSALETTRGCAMNFAVMKLPSNKHQLYVTALCYTEITKYQKTNKACPGNIWSDSFINLTMKAFLEGKWVTLVISKWIWSFLHTSRYPIGPGKGYSHSLRSSSRNFPAFPLDGGKKRP